jgi:hypothetical protein
MLPRENHEPPMLADSLRRKRSARRLAVALHVALLPCAAATAQVANNPGYDRPGLGFAPAVLQSGDVTLEHGVPDWSHADGASVHTADSLLRLGLGHGLELQFGTGWNWLDTTGVTASGRSDTSLGLKVAPRARGDFSWGLLGSVEFPDGARMFRVGQRQYQLGASLNWQHDDGRSTGMYAEMLHGDANSELLAVNEGWSPTPGTGVYVEAATQHVAGSGYGGVAGAGLSWQVTPRLQLDFGARRRIAGHADAWQGGLGVSVYFGG